MVKFRWLARIPNHERKSLNHAFVQIPGGNFACCKPRFSLQSTDVEGHPEKDGSSSHVAKHSPSKKKVAARSFILSGEISALQSDVGALSRGSSR